MTMEIWLLVFVSLSTILIFLYLTTNPYPNIYRYDEEKTFYDVKSKSDEKFPFGLNDKPVVDLSVIIPAYNEKDRRKLSSILISNLVEITLDEMIEYFDIKKKMFQKFTYEIIIVDDGSLDRTSEVAITYAEDRKIETIRVLKLRKNRGKGGAVRLGMLSARGKFLIFADADGATKFSDIESLEKKMAESISQNWNGSMAVVCGSRAHLEDNVVAKRNPIRNILMYGFHFAVWFLCVRGIKDTQCGFKLFSRQAARILFMNLHVERWAFDVDLLFLARKLNIEVIEVPVNWHEVDGSKIVPIFSWLQMAKDLLLIRLRYSLGAWKIEPPHRLQ